MIFSFFRDFNANFTKCFCDANMLLINDNGDCVAPNECPCYYRGLPYMNGQHFYERCMRCDCVNSELVCQTDADCEDDGCSGGRIWNDCVLCSSEITCQNHHFRESLCDASGNTLCSIGGCRCPGSSVFHNDSCIDVTECPCDVEGHAFAQGEIWGDDCNQW